MKPVVSSIVALALAIAPFTASAASPEKPAPKAHAVTVVKHAKKANKASKAERASRDREVDKRARGAKGERGAATVERDDERERVAKSERGERIVRVRHTEKSRTKAPLHHAHGVEVGGGHSEPKIDRGIAVIPAALASRPSLHAASHVKPLERAKVERTKPIERVKAVSEEKPTEIPKLPNPNATTGSKSGSEKGARKATEKKHDDAADSDGKPGRDGELADLVARIRGKSEGASKKDAKDADATDESDDARQTKADSKATSSDAKKGKRTERQPVCVKDPIEVIRGPEIDKFELTKCDGKVAPLAVEHLSVLVRPGSAARPTAPLAELAKKAGKELAHGIHRVDERLALRLQALADHFAKPGSPLKLSIVSGYRPTSIGSMHATGRAVDFRIEGTKNEEVIAFCKTLVDTGCGYYPNSSFVHLDVRDPGVGHVSWIDASGPGETPRYVTTWPPAPNEGARKKLSDLQPASAREPVTTSPEGEGADDAEVVDEHGASPTKTGCGETPAPAP